MFQWCRFFLYCVVLVASYWLVLFLLTCTSPCSLFYTFVYNWHNILPIYLIKSCDTFDVFLYMYLAFSGFRVTRSWDLCVFFVDRCLVFLSFFFWPLCCLSFLNIRIRIWYIQTLLEIFVLSNYFLNSLILPKCNVLIPQLQS